MTQPITDHKLNDLIARALEHHWLHDEQTTLCFDRTEENLEAMLRFRRGEADEEAAAAVREHLLECARCRYVYAKCRAF